MKKYEASFYEHIDESDNNVETLTLIQSYKDDFFKTEINLQRWRPKAMLVEYLRTIADIIEKHPIDDKDSGKHKWIGLGGK
jgi:hypothetical protein